MNFIIHLNFKSYDYLILSLKEVKLYFIGYLKLLRLLLLNTRTASASACYHVMSRILSPGLLYLYMLYLVMQHYSTLSLIHKSKTSASLKNSKNSESKNRSVCQLSFSLYLVIG